MYKALHGAVKGEIRIRCYPVKQNPGRIGTNKKKYLCIQIQIYSMRCDAGWLQKKVGPIHGSPGDQWLLNLDDHITTSVGICWETKWAFLCNCLATVRIDWWTKMGQGSDPAGHCLGF